MSPVIELWVRRRSIAVCIVAVGLAGCSGDSTRFNDDPFGPKASNDYTGSALALPTGQVQQSQLPPPSQGEQAAGPKELVPYTPARHSGIGASTQRAAGASKLGRDSGPAKQSVSTASVGTSVGGDGSGMATTSGSSVHVVGRGETLSRIARHYRRSVYDIAKANKIEPHATLRIGDRLTIPGPRTNAPPKDSAGGKPAAPRTRIASAEPTQNVSLVSPVADAPAVSAAAKPNGNGAPSLRWPVKGRVIAGFGPKTNGQQNDGINLAVPEGTPIKAAEDGIVAYAGNELKGYGNLVLVRHPGGYVTAYAHAKELMVKRGDEVKRGQIIAKSGQTGNVDAPQLHFEVRKGQAPIDPIPLLSGG